MLEPLIHEISPWMALPFCIWVGHGDVKIWVWGLKRLVFIRTLQVDMCISKSVCPGIPQNFYNPWRKLQNSTYRIFVPRQPVILPLRPPF